MSTRPRTASFGLVLGLSLLAGPALAAPATAEAIVAHPRELVYPELKYDAPRRADFRHVLRNGVVVYVVPDRALPLVDVSVTARAGDYLDPAGKEGLAAMTADQMRSGGAGKLDADAFDEELDFFAVQLGIGSDTREARASLNVLSKDLEKGLDLLFAALREPRFQQDRIDVYKTRTLQGLERRNDSTTTIEQREWFRLAFGPDHFESLEPTRSSLESITREDLAAFHRRWWQPAGLVVAVSGDVRTEDVLPALERRFGGWAAGEKAPAPKPPTASPGRSVQVVNKDDVNQTRVSMGHLGIVWSDPNAQAVEVMNEILGGGGFISRITTRVRSDEGLAYSAGSGFGVGREYPRSFRAAFQSKNRSVARAAQIVVEEMKRMQAEPVTDEELSVAKTSFVETFPRRFATARAKANVFVEDELYGRPADYWEQYRPRVRAVTKEDVQRVARQYLHPDALAVLVVGKIDEVLAGDPEHPEFSLAPLAGPEGIREIPLPDPSTLAYPHAPKPVAAGAATKTGG